MSAANGPRVVWIWECADWQEWAGNTEGRPARDLVDAEFMTELLWRPMAELSTRITTTLVVRRPALSVQLGAPRREDLVVTA